MQEFEIRIDDSTLYYRKTGSGEPVMLVHGFGEDSRIWDDLLPALSEQYLLIIPDLAGSGKSAGKIEGMSLEGHAEHLKQLMDKEELAACAMIGHSMGGYIALAFAHRYPERLTRFGLFHSTAYADNDEKKEARQKNIAFIKKHGSAKFLEQAVPNLFSKDFLANNAALVEEFIDRYSNFSPDALVSYTEAMMNRPDRTDVLQSFTKPVLFIMGEFDTAVPLEQGLKQCSIPEFSYIYICTHSGHMGMLEEPEFCLNAMQDFLSAR